MQYAIEWISRVRDICDRYALIYNINYARAQTQLVS